MTAPQRSEQDLSRLLGELAAGPRPDYRDSLVLATARARQRPAWTFPGRWLPMDVATVSPRTASVPIRALLLAALLLLALLAALLAVVGSRPRLPAPFGPAANGIVVYGANGNLYALDATGGAARPFLADPATDDSHPQFSPLGDRVAFARAVDGAWELRLADAAGGDARRLTDRLIGLEVYDWSPDGRQIAAHHRVHGRDVVSVIATDGSGSRDLALDFPAGDPLWRPGHDGQLLVRGTQPYALYLVDTADDTATKLDLPFDAVPAPQYNGQRPAWSPDGTRLVVEQGLARFSDAGRPVIRLLVADVTQDGRVTASRPLERDPGADYEYGATWLTTGAGIGFGSQAGCRFQVYVAAGEDLAGATPVGEPIDDCTNEGVGLTLAPDGTRVIAQHTSEGGDAMWLGGVDGIGRVPLGTTTTDGPTWQRLAP